MRMRYSATSKNVLLRATAARYSFYETEYNRNRWLRAVLREHTSCRSTVHA
jgi:hypothetical protein